jgi:hypothetical protein
LYLWAGGGLVLLLSFALLVVVYLVDAGWRFRLGTAEERRLLFWTVSLCFVLLANSASGIVLTVPGTLLVFWILMALPMTVRTEARGAASLI